MDKRVCNMLDQMFDLINQKSVSSQEAWDRLTDFLAADNSPRTFHQLLGHLNWLFEDVKLAHNLMLIYNRELLKLDFHNCLTEIYQDRVLRKRIIHESQTPTQRLSKESKNLVQSEPAIKSITVPSMSE